MLTPRQLASQISVHEDITKRMYGTSNAPEAKSGSKVANAGYIDQIPGW